MKITVNGEIREAPPSSTVLGLLESVGVEPGETVVMRNGEIIERAAFAGTALAEEDKLELVRFVGGG